MLDVLNHKNVTILKNDKKFNFFGFGVKCLCEIHPNLNNWIWSHIVPAKHVFPRWMNSSSGHKRHFSRAVAQTSSAGWSGRTQPWGTEVPSGCSEETRNWSHSILSGETPYEHILWVMSHLLRVIFRAYFWSENKPYLNQHRKRALCLCVVIQERLKRVIRRQFS